MLSERRAILYSSSISGFLVGRCPFGRMSVSKLLGFGEPAMPVDLQPPKKPNQPVAILPLTLLDRSLNWLALVVGIGLCVWAVNYGSNLLT